MRTVAVLAALPVLFACSHPAPKHDELPAASIGSSNTSPSTAQEGQTSDNGNAFGLETIHFAYDSSLLDSSDKAIAKKDASVLKSNPTLKVQIEGHCDARGGIQYNVALGERRAKAVKHLLEDYGVSGHRIETISYGKERPIDTAETEEAYAKNRRANFVVTHSMM